VTDVSRLAPPEGRELVQMLPAAAYTSDEVLAWERR
jgi:glycine betaine catabolism A